MISPVHTWVAEKTGLGGTLNPLTLSEWQQEKWRQMVRYARAMTRFYRDLPEVGDISQLPFTTPADFAKDALAFLAEHVRPKGIVRDDFDRDVRGHTLMILQVKLRID